MAHRKKSWVEKLEDREGFPKILKLERRFPCYNAVHKMGAEEGDLIVLANPSDVVKEMKGVGEGSLATILEICRNIAEKYQVRACCTLTAGIFITIAANAAEEARKGQNHLDIPYWRTLKAGGFLDEKYPGGAESHKKLLEKEGFTVVRKGSKYKVMNYQEFLQQGKQAGVG